jgi:pyruvate dehydrogenase E2 component (dihydrolipoamide acetyltransferase)
MPRLSDSMEEGTIIKWLKSSGEEVRLGEPIAEIETDKATMTYEADAAGFLQIVAAEGESLLIGAVIAHLLGSAADAAAEPVRKVAAPAAQAPAGADVAAEAAPAPQPAAVSAAPESEQALQSAEVSQLAPVAVATTTAPRSWASTWPAWPAAGPMGGSSRPMSSRQATAGRRTRRQRRPPSSAPRAPSRCSSPAARSS